MTKGQIAAQKLLSENGLTDIIDFPMGTLVAALDATLIEEDLQNCDGRIIFGQSKTIIKVNSKIPFEQRKRFVIAHEIGHLIMHKGIKLPDDSFENFNIIAGTEKFLKNGEQELEANEFASELLMPADLFKKEAKEKKFSPNLIHELAQKFNTSLTATVFRYLQCDLYPICIVFTQNGRVKYWKKSDDLYVWLKPITKLAPPSDSVASEYIQKGYEFIYKGNDKAQIIGKSTWFQLKDDDEDTDFYEYCIPTKAYQSVLSVIWED